ncbi:MAG TPA: hypothetical protein VGG95_02880 [Edaphobacter sp.]
MMAYEPVAEDKARRWKSLRLIPGDSKTPVELGQRRTSGDFATKMQIGGRSSSHRESQPGDNEQRRSEI